MSKMFVQKNRYPNGRCTTLSFVGNFQCDRDCVPGKKLCKKHQEHADYAEAMRRKQLKRLENKDS